MSDYRETEIIAKKWRRCARIEINNPPAPQLPTVLFLETDVAIIDGRTTELGRDALSATFEPSAAIDLLDPETLQPTGETVSEGAVYLALFSKYIAAAAARDLRQSETALPGA